MGQVLRSKGLFQELLGSEFSKKRSPQISRGWDSIMGHQQKPYDLWSKISRKTPPRLVLGDMNILHHLVSTILLQISSDIPSSLQHVHLPRLCLYPGHAGPEYEQVADQQQHQAQHLHTAFAVRDLPWRGGNPRVEGPVDTNSLRCFVVSETATKVEQLSYLNRKKNWEPAPLLFVPTRSCSPQNSHRVKLKDQEQLHSSAYPPISDRHSFNSTFYTPQPSQEKSQKKKCLWCPRCAKDPSGNLQVIW